jgi:pimeloyl-ACP methyl ester carboxylesterase
MLSNSQFQFKTSIPGENISRAPGAAEAHEPPRTWVVLVHGLFATPASMSTLEMRLRTQGYQVLNWGYHTLWRSTQQHVDSLAAELRALHSDPQVACVHFVTHSMGGIIARGALHAGCDHKVRRMVMLAPPNRGSHLTRLSPSAVAWCVPAIADLSEAPDSLPHRLNIAEHIEVGIIAADRDFVVSIANTRLHNQREHCVVRGTHFQLPSNNSVVDKVVNFLRQGCFTDAINASVTNPLSAAGSLSSLTATATSRAA